MAKISQHFLTHIIILVVLILVSATKESQAYSTPLNPNTLSLKKEKLTHLHFFFHDIVNGENKTAIPVAMASTTRASPTDFGLIMMMDDPLTETLELTSTGTIGFSQGIYASASQTQLGLLMAFNFVFTKGKYNGSTLSVLGHNPIFTNPREMPILGGTGLFRFARGYAIAKSVFADSFLNDLKLFNAIVEYNVYVFHYE